MPAALTASTFPTRTRRPAARLCASLCALAMLAAAVPMPVRAQNDLPALGDAATEDFGVGAERRAAPKPARIPLGDRPMYPSGEGLQ